MSALVFLAVLVALHQRGNRKRSRRSWQRRRDEERRAQRAIARAAREGET